MDYKFDRPRLNKISKEKIIQELEEVAKKLNYIEFGWRDFNREGNITRSPVVKEFGSWKNAIIFLRNHLKEKGIELKVRKIQYITDKELFDEMERIWKWLGHRPSRTEWEQSDAKISYNCYKQRFDGWSNACLKFIEFKMGENVSQGSSQKKDVDKDIVSSNQTSSNPHIYDPEKSRTIPLGLRLKVLKRDNFRCVFCGRSPATDIGVKLHIDHIIPFSKEGKTELNNLQTLCEDCNLGKSNRN